MRQFSFFIVLLLFCVKIVQAQDGGLDASFGVNGVTRVDSVHAAGPFIASTIQPDGKILIATMYQSYDSAGTANGNGIIVKRFLPNGQLDNLFNPHCRIQLYPGISSENLCQLSLQSNGRILAGDIQNLIGLLPDGSIDSTFGIFGKIHFAGQYCHLVLANDKILMASTTNTLRLWPNGKPDSTYGINGMETFFSPISLYIIYMVKRTPDNGIILAANPVKFNGSVLVKLDANGDIDRYFGAAGYIQPKLVADNDFISDLKIDGIGNIMVAGLSDDYSAPYLYSSIVRYRSNGIVDTGFGISGKRFVDSIVNHGYNKGQFAFSALYIQEDGRILSSLNYTDTSDSFQLALRRFFPDGSIDESFGTKGKTVVRLSDFDIPGSILVQPDSKIIVAGGGGLEQHLAFPTLRSFYLARFYNSLHLGVLSFQNKTGSPAIYPNPLQSSANFGYELRSDEVVSIFLTDMSGSLVQTFVSREKRAKGTHTEPLIFNHNIAPGNYFLHISNKTGTESIRITKM